MWEVNGETGGRACGESCSEWERKLGSTKLQAGCGENGLGRKVGEADGGNRAGQDATYGRRVMRKLDAVSAELYATVGWRTGMPHCSVTTQSCFGRGFDIYYRKAGQAGRLGTDTSQAVLTGRKQQ